MATETKREWEARHASVKGDRVHRTIALLAHQGCRPATGYETLLAVSDATAESCADLPSARPRERALLQGVMTGAAVYLRQFMPGVDWECLGGEWRLPRSRPDIVWHRRCDGGVLIDEVKTGTNTAAHTRVRDQVTRHLTGATEVWGDKFVGVRLLWLSAPLSSQFFAAGSTQPVPLRETAFWGAA